MTAALDFLAGFGAGALLIAGVSAAVMVFG